MDWAFYLLAFLVAVAITASAVYALNWALKDRQFDALEKGASVIFDDEEPAGTPTDAFPGQAAAPKPRSPN